MSLLTILEGSRAPAGGTVVVSGNSTSQWLGDSQTAATAVLSIADWTNFFLNGQLIHPALYNQGVSGNKTDDMIARQSTGLATNPAIYWVLAGTNDIVLGGYPASTTITNYQTIIANAKANPSVKLIVFRTILKRSGANALTAPQEATRNTINNWLRALNDPMIKVIDYDLSAFDPTIHTSDGLHPNQLGAILLGRYNAAAVAANITVVDVSLDTTGQLFVGGDLSGTAGTFTASGVGATITGQVATGWQLRNFLAGVAAVCSKGTDAFGNATQIMTLNGTSTANGNINFRNVSAYTGAAAEIYELIATWNVSSGAALASCLTACDGVLAFGTASTYTNPANQALSGVIRPGRGALAGTDTSNDFNLNAYYPSGTVFVNETFVLSRPRWRKIA